jgi:hypothetical protein
MKTSFSSLLNIVLFFFLLAFSACGGSSKSDEAGTYESESYETTDMEMASPEGKRESVSIDRKLIKHGNVEFESYNLSETRKNILNAVKKYEAYVSSDQEYEMSGKVMQRLEIRVPAKNFDAMLAEATKGISTFDEKVITVSDVTEEYVDVEARLAAKKELEQRYVDLLKQANSVSEILEIERELGNVRAEIESMEGRLNYLKDQVAMSTINISFYEAVSNQEAFAQRVKESLSGGWDNLKDFLVGVVGLWPFIIIFTVLIWMWRRVRRRRKA